MLNWTNTGREYTAGNEEKLAGIFAGLDWKPFEPEGLKTEAWMPAIAIVEAIEQLRIPRASHYAISHALAPYGLIAVRGHYRQGEVNVYLADEGDFLVALASEPLFEVTP